MAAIEILIEGNEQIAKAIFGAIRQARSQRGWAPGPIYEDLSDEEQMQWLSIGSAVIRDLTCVQVVIPDLNSVLNQKRRRGVPPGIAGQAVAKEIKS